MIFEINPNENNHGKWDVSKFIVNDLIPKVDCWPYPLDEMMLMIGVTTYIKPEIIIEWGTNQGRSTTIFLETIIKWNLKSQIHTIDLPPDVEHPENPKESIGLFYKRHDRYLDYITQHFGDGIEVAKDLSKYYKNILFFVDGDHHEDSVTREIKELLKLDLPEYNVLFHDAYLSDREDYYCGVYKAIEKNLLKNKNVEIVYSSFINTGLPGMMYLQFRKKEKK